MGCLEGNQKVTLEFFRNFLCNGIMRKYLITAFFVATFFLATSRVTFADCGTYNESQSWCLGGDVLICLGGNPQVMKSCAAGTVCRVTDGTNKAADCIATNAPGCVDQGVYHTEQEQFCSSDKSAVIMCNKTNGITQVVACQPNSCQDNGNKTASCIDAVNNQPVKIDQNFVDALGGKLQCGGIAERCCQKTTLPRAEVPLPDGPGVSIIKGFLQGFLDLSVNFAADAINTTIHSISAGKVCYEGLPNNPSDLTKCKCLPKASLHIAELCDPIKDPGENTACIKCSLTGIWTSLGCIDYNLQDFFKNIVFGWGLGIAGGAALACIIWAAFIIAFSRGDATRLKKGQELLTSCITGLVLILFSVFILRLIGVTILRIPGFS